MELQREAWSRTRAILEEDCGLNGAAEANTLLRQAVLPFCTVKSNISRYCLRDSAAKVISRRLG